MDSDWKELYDFRLSLGFEPCGPKTSSSSSRIGIASSRSPDDLAPACDPENKGAGGSGLFGLLPYFDEGVPGLGLPLRSTVSYGMSEGGGREESEEVREIVDREGEV